MTTKIHKHQMFDIPIASNEEVLDGIDVEKAISSSGLTNKILGEVEYDDILGIPTGAIMESGDNVNGQWMKLANGVAIGFQHKDLSGITS